MSAANQGSLHVGCAFTEAKVVLVFIHGRGQSPEAINDHVIVRLQMTSVACLLPRAPTGSWYNAKAVDPLLSPTRVQLGEALSQIESLVQTVPKSMPLVIGGFSQGACVALEYALKNGSWNGALVSLTGCRVGIKSDERPAASLANFPVYLSGSNVDPWIPVKAWAEAAEALNAAGARLRCESFPGRSHEVSAAEIEVLDSLLHALAHGEPIWDQSW